MIRPNQDGSYSYFFFSSAQGKKWNQTIILVNLEGKTAIATHFEIPKLPEEAKPF
jgi:hypothetical protein